MERSRVSRRGHGPAAARPGWARHLAVAVSLGRPEEVAWVGHLKVTRRLPAILSAEEIERLLAALPSLKHVAIVMVAYGAGLRISEVCHLRVEDIHSQRMVIHALSRQG
ncbi:MAG: tyrosine-type recombinase/integrase [Polyangiaceae bacterium]|nr:tyrosine-type recombinase/integrase [Polyangiaceae bacterium]